MNDFDNGDRADLSPLDPLGDTVRFDDIIARHRS